MNRQNRFKRPSKTRPRGRERSRQIAVLAAMAGVLVAGLLVAGKYEVWQTLFGRLAAEQTAAKSDVKSDDEIYTGTILYEPHQGTICREFLFDNRTGRVQDNGLVDCDQAYYRGPSDASAQSAAPRAVVISQSFRHR